MSAVRLLVPFDDINKRINVRAEIVPVKLCAVVIVLINSAIEIGVAWGYRPY